MDSGLFWVKARRVNGDWRTDFEQAVYGAASREMRTKSIRLDGLSRIVVTDTDGKVTVYTRDGEGRMLRDGVLFESGRPGVTIQRYGG